MSRTNFAYRSVCTNCKVVAPEEHLDSSDFWSRTPCPLCGDKMETRNCRFVRKNKFKFTNISSWKAVWEVEFRE